MKYLWTLLALWPVLLLAQIEGVVYGVEGNREIALAGANVFWKGTESGTVTDAEGKFSLPKHPSSNTLVAQFVGYQTQSQVVIFPKGQINFRLLPDSEQLQAVDVKAKDKGTLTNLKSAGLELNLSKGELRKAACCNLSESFETNASVDINYSDAVTGQKQIEMLGLSGKYVLIQRENVPHIRGVNASNGMAYVPGPFVESIQLTKGLSSVLNGFESMTGQINVELYKPETSPKLLLNAYGNMGSRFELNALSSLQKAENFGSNLLFHASTVAIPQDMNGDGFADMPIGNQVSLMSRNHWRSATSGWEGQLGFALVNDNKRSGQLSYLNDRDVLAWGYTAETERYEVFGKNGYIFDANPYKSLGLIYSASFQSNRMLFGERQHQTQASSFYFNSIFQNLIGTSAHRYKTGISFQLDDNLEDLSFQSRISGGDSNLYRRESTEWVPGAYFEYTFEPNERFIALLGLRGDYMSFYERFILTPRVNLRYNPSEQSTVRASAGKGYRSSLPIAENMNVLASARRLNLAGIRNLSLEESWNYGLSYTQLFSIGKRVLSWNTDVFYTSFANKLVVDLDQNPQEAYFNFNRRASSISVMTQLDYAVLEGFDIRLAYKYLRAEEEFNQKTDLSYFVPAHRAFVNLAYATKSDWKFDFTLNWFGAKRLPETALNPVEFQQPEFSPDFWVANAQVSKVWKDFEFFVGAENLFNFQMERPILDPQNPFGSYFDSNFAWGPIFGRNIYIGLYYTLEED